MFSKIAHFNHVASMVESVTTPYYQMKDSISFEHRDPIGIVGCRSPWNFPLWLLCGKIAPALACGNCVVGKPSEYSPISAHILTHICDKIGLPSGVLNIIHGKGETVGESIVSNPHIGAMSFTVSTSTGRNISSIAAPMLKKLQLELGVKNPSIVFDDCYSLS